MRNKIRSILIYLVAPGTPPFWSRCTRLSFVLAAPQCEEDKSRIDHAVAKTAAGGEHFRSHRSSSITASIADTLR